MFDILGRKCFNGNNSIHYVDMILANNMNAMAPR